MNPLSRGPVASDGPSSQEQVPESGNSAQRLLFLVLLLPLCQTASSQTLETKSQLPAISQLSNIAGYGWQPGFPCARIARAALTCDSAGFVTSLTLPATVGAYLPDTIGNLTRMTSLVIRNNLFSDVIPESIGRLQRLRNLDLSGNLFSGPLPAAMSGMTGLTNLNVSYNLFTGRVPLGLQTLRSLVTLDLSHNYFSGSASFRQACPGVNLASNCFAAGSSCTVRGAQRTVAECAAACNATVWQPPQQARPVCSNAGQCLPSGAVTAGVASNWKCYCNPGYLNAGDFSCQTCGACPKNSECKYADAIKKVACTCRTGYTTIFVQGKQTCQKCTTVRGKRTCKI